MRFRNQPCGSQDAVIEYGARGSQPMTSTIAGGVDCDLHPAVPHPTSLLPYLNDYWRDQVTTREWSTWCRNTIRQIRR
jgi:hypothetical protein